MSRLKDMLIRHEGLRLKPYLCSSRKLTIGVGRNLEDLGISKEEAMTLLENDIFRCFEELKDFAWFASLDANRQDVLLNMVFNLGLPNLLTFKKFIAALSGKNYEAAANEMLDSVWAKQVGRRAEELSEIMRTGNY